MTEDEIMRRAREAVIAADLVHYSYRHETRAGENDHWPMLKAAAQALRDIDKPLANPWEKAAEEYRLTFDECTGSEYCAIIAGLKAAAKYIPRGE